MNPLKPSPRLLRRIAHLLGATSDPGVCAWVVAMQALPKPRPSNLFPGTSVVRTFRCGKLCGFEVWRHLGGLRENPSRKKARLWFGCTRHGGERRARQLAYFAAATMSKMSARELAEWWSEYTAARAANRPVSNLWRDEPRFLDGLDAAERKHLFCALR